MAALLVAYDFKSQNQDYLAFYSEIEHYFHIKLSPSSYVIYTNQPASYVYKKLKSSIEAKDCLYIIPLNKPWAGFGPRENRDWLMNYLS